MMATRPGLTFETAWKPFFLDTALPRHPEQGVDKRMHYDMKFGRDRVAAMLPRMVAVSAAEDPPIAMSYGGTIGNSLDSHRLIGWAAAEGRPVGLQDAIVESLMKAYFVEEKNVGDRTVLSDVITRAMPGDPALVAEAEAFIGSDAGEAETMTEADDLRRANRINGVPFFIIDGKYGISGAQEADTFVEIFTKIAEEAGVAAGVAATAATGASCSIDNPQNC